MPDEAPQPTKTDQLFIPAKFERVPTLEDLQLTDDQKRKSDRLWEIHKRGLRPDKVIGDP